MLSIVRVHWFLIGRAYHQNCLSPPIKPEAFPGEEEDWFCWQCECLADCLEMLEEEFHVGSPYVRINGTLRDWRVVRRRQEV